MIVLGVKHLLGKHSITYGKTINIWYDTGNHKESEK